MMSTICLLEHTDTPFFSSISLGRKGPWNALTVCLDLSGLGGAFVCGVLGCFLELAGARGRESGNEPRGPVKGNLILRRECGNEPRGLLKETMKDGF